MVCDSALVKPVAMLSRVEVEMLPGPFRDWDVQGTQSVAFL